MSRIKKKFIRYGIGADDSNARDIPGNFTPTNYTPAQVASEGNDKISAHLNGLDTKVGGLPAPSGGDISETSFAGANNVTIFTDITGFAFANGTVRAFDALVSVTVDAAADLYSVVTLHGIQKGADWEISIKSVGDDALVEFDITTSGQIQYKSDNYLGFVSLTVKFRAITVSV